MVKTKFVVLASWLMSASATADQTRKLDAISLATTPTRLLGWQLELRLPVGGTLETKGWDRERFVVGRGRAELVVDVSETYGLPGNSFAHSVAAVPGGKTSSVETIFAKDGMTVLGIQPSDRGRSGLVYSAFIGTPKNSIKRMDLTVSPKGDSSYAWSDLAKAIAATAKPGRNVLRRGAGTRAFCPLEDCASTVDVPDEWSLLMNDKANSSYRLQRISTFATTKQSAFCDLVINGEAAPVDFRGVAGTEVVTSALQTNARWRLAKRRSRVAARVSLVRSVATTFGVYCEAETESELRSTLAIMNTMRAAQYDGYGEAYRFVDSTP
jgi:hypothetical protein